MDPASMKHLGERKFVTWVILLLLIGLLAIAWAYLNTPAQAADTCPEDGKVEAVADELDDIVLEEGTEVCIKGGTVLRTLTADGTSTLKELLDNRNENGVLRSVSHYTILTLPPITTTTTEPVTTTSESSTTTTTEEVSSTTSTLPSTTTTVTNPPTTSTSTTEKITTTTEDEDDPVLTTLPYTGSGGSIGLALGAITLIAAGVGLLRRVGVA